MKEQKQLTTETRNEKSKHLDEMSALEIATLMNGEDQKVALAVQKCLPQIAQAIESVAKAIKQGGRLLYIGAGTSGRLAVLDASECWPTFGVEHGVVVGTIAGGDRALRYSVENSEDSREGGVADLMALKPTKKDVVMGLSAGGGAPYILAILEKAQQLGIKTIGYSSNTEAKLKAFSNIFINPVVGPEVLTGSSRLKSGTAQKMVLNQITTGAFTLVGKVYENLMIDVRVMNEKLRDRAMRIICDITGVERDVAERCLAESQKFLKEPTKGVPLAVVMSGKNLPARAAAALLKQHDGFVKKALNAQTPVKKKINNALLINSVRHLSK